MTEETDDVFVAGMDRLSGSVSDLAVNVTDLLSYGKRNRVLIRALACSLIFDICLSIGGGFIAVQAHDASDRAERASSASALNKATLKAGCVSGNVQRADFREFFGTLAEAIPTATAGSQQALATIVSNADNTFAARTC